jgi:predicted RNA-binding Zn-ribbon protein involved in translation (DUF1610 family)
MQRERRLADNEAQERDAEHERRLYDPMPSAWPSQQGVSIVNSSGHHVHSPSCGEEHEKRTAECRDGSVSYSEHHRGTCSYHGGVAHWD